MAKFFKKIKARELRRKGKSIKEIAKMLEVSKSTASIWCFDIRLSADQITALHKRMAAASYAGSVKGAQVLRKRKLEKIERYTQQGEAEIGTLNKRDTLFLGLGLYLGEGNKSGNSVQFVNSNPAIIRAIMEWLRLFGVRNDDYYCNVIINARHRDNASRTEKRWAEMIGISPDQFKKTVLIKSTNKKIYENSDDYMGTLVLRVHKSSEVQYRIVGLMNGLMEKWKRKNRPG